MAVGLVRMTVGSVSFAFDFNAQRIDIGASTDTLQVETLWTAIKTAQWRTQGLEHDEIATGSGLDALQDEVETYLTVTLLDDWELNSLKSSGKFTVKDGNLIKANGLDPFVDNPLITYFLFLSQSGTVARVSTGSGLSVEQSAQLQQTWSKTVEAHRIAGNDSDNPVIITTDAQGRIAQVNAGDGHVIDVVHSEGQSVWSRQP